MLLRESMLSLEKAIEICRTFETTQKQVDEMNLEQQIEKVRSSKPPQDGNASIAVIRMNRADYDTQTGGKHARIVMMSIISNQNAESE